MTEQAPGLNGRITTIQRFRILVIVYLIAACTLVICGIMIIYQFDSKGALYCIGGFCVGFLDVVIAVVSTCIVRQAPKFELNDAGKREVTSWIAAQHLLTIVVSVMCAVWFVLVLSGFRETDIESLNNGNKIPAIIILVCCSFTVIVNIYSICTNCSYRKFFNHHVEHNQNRQLSASNEMGGMVSLTVDQNQLRIIEEQNMLLQQQVLLQQQLIQQQQQHILQYELSVLPSYSDVCSNQEEFQVMPSAPSINYA